MASAVNSLAVGGRTGRDRSWSTVRAVHDIAGEGLTKGLEVEVGPAAKAFEEASTGGDNGACAPWCLVYFSKDIKLAMGVVNSH